MGIGLEPLVKLFLVRLQQAASGSPLWILGLGHLAFGEPLAGGVARDGQLARSLSHGHAIAKDHAAQFAKSSHVYHSCTPAEKFSRIGARRGSNLLVNPLQCGSVFSVNQQYSDHQLLSVVRWRGCAKCFGLITVDRMADSLHCLHGSHFYVARTGTLLSAGDTIVAPNAGILANTSAMKSMNTMARVGSSLLAT